MKLGVTLRQVKINMIVLVLKRHSIENFVVFYHGKRIDL